MYCSEALVELLEEAVGLSIATAIACQAPLLTADTLIRQHCPAAFWDREPSRTPTVAEATDL